MKKNMKNILFLIIILMLAFSLRSYTPLKNERVVGIDSYFHIRSVDYLVENGQMMEYDGLVSGQKAFFYMPFFHYLLAPLYLLFKTSLIFRLIPAILGTIFVYVAYLIFKRLVKEPLFPTFLIATLPVLIYKQSTLMSSNLNLLLVALLIYSIIEENEKMLFIFSVISAFTHPFLLFVPVAYILSLLFQKNKKGIALKISAFTQILLTLTYIFIKGIKNLSQNIPIEIKNKIMGLSDWGFLVYKQINLPILTLLVLPWGYMDKNKNNFVVLTLALPLIGFLLKLITLDRALALGAIGIVYIATLNYEKIKSKEIMIIFIIMVLFSSFLAINQLSWGVIDDETHEGLVYLNDISFNEDVILTGDKGHWVQYYSNRKIFYDTHFYGYNATYRYTVMDTIFSGLVGFEDNIKDNNIKYILITQDIKDQYPNSKKTFEESELLVSVFENREIQIFKVQ